MAFLKSSRPRRPGAYVNFEAQAATVLPPSQGAIQAVPGTHDWGPFKQGVLCTSYEAFKAIYGTNDSPLQRAVMQAFRGEGILNRAGAGAVLAYRFGGSAAAKATRTIVNTAGSPVTGLTLTARYEGARGNSLRVTSQDNAVSSANNDLVILDGTVEVERYTYADTDIAGLAAVINATSDWVTAAVNVGGVALNTTITASAFTGGNDGTTVLAADWTDVRTALSPKTFSVLGLYDMTDSGVLASFVTWSQGLNATGKRFMTVVGGGTSDTPSAAITRSGSINDPNFVNLGVGTFDDDELGTLSTAQLTTRIGGIMCARGESSGITFVRLAGITRINSAATPAQIDQCFDGGVTVFAEDAYEPAPVHSEKGLTTYTTTNDAARPYLTFREPKFMRIMHGIEADAKQLGTDPGFLGERPVNDKTRQWAVGEMRARMEARETNEIIQPGHTVGVDQDPPPSDDDNFVALRIGVKFSRDVEQFYLTATVG